MRRLALLPVLILTTFLLAANVSAVPITSYSEIAGGVDTTVTFEDLGAYIGHQFGYGAGDPYLSLGLDMGFEVVENYDIGSDSGGISVHSATIYAYEHTNFLTFSFTGGQDAVGFYFEELDATYIEFIAYDDSGAELESFTLKGYGYAGFSRESADIYSISIYAPNIDFDHAADTRLYIDDISFSALPASVPEPATLFLLGISLAGIAAVRKRKLKV